MKLEHERINFGGIWHSDTTYLETPPMGTMLIAREVPPYGGDTLFANQYLAYETLSDGMKRLLDGLDAVNIVGQGRRHRAPARTASATARATMPEAVRSPSIRWCAPIRRPAARRSTSTSATPTASTA